jgi:hypothetical protein
MNTSDRFLRFAAECEVMAKFSRTPENRAVWNGLAERWVRCAKLMDRKDSEYYTPLPEAPSKGHLQFGALTKSRHARELLGFTPLAVGFIRQLCDFFQNFQNVCLGRHASLRLSRSGSSLAQRRFSSGSRMPL